MNNQPFSKRPIHLGRGVFFTLLAFFGLAIMAATGKAGQAAGLSTSSLVFFQSLFALILTLPLIVSKKFGGFQNLKTDRLGLHLIRGVAGVCAFYLWFLSLKSISLMDGALLLNSSPLFMPLIASVWLKKKISFELIFCLLVGFVGTILILHPDRNLLHLGSISGLTSGMVSALAFLAIGQLSTTEPPLRMLFYYFFISIIASAPFVIAEWEPPSAMGWAYLILAALCLISMQFLLVKAYQNAPASHLSPFNYSGVLFSALIGWLIWDQIPPWYSYIGTTLVCIGAILTMLYLKREFARKAAEAVKFSDTNSKK